MAYKTFANGFPLPASDLNNFLMNQSVIVFADAAARTTAIPSPVTGMLTYLVDTSAYESWNGSAFVALAEDPDLSSLIPKSTVTTAQDLIVADGASSVTRLGVGADDQVLSVVSGAVAWADASSGGMELLSTTTLSGTFTEVGSISQDYKNLIIAIDNVQHSAVSQPLYIRVNGAATNNQCVSMHTSGSSTFLRKSSEGVLNTDNGMVSDNNAFLCTIFNYSSTTENKVTTTTGGYTRYDTTNKDLVFASGWYSADSAVSAIQTRLSSGSFTGGTMKIYGAN
jgi:hypothetical protein